VLSDRAVGWVELLRDAAIPPPRLMGIASLDPSYALIRPRYELRRNEFCRLKILGYQISSNLGLCYAYL
jgi:hypothetical protein